MTPNEYKINTIQDIIDSTNTENLDRFLIDLKGIVMSAHILNELEEVKVKCDGFDWIDDGEHKIDIEIHGL